MSTDSRRRRVERDAEIVAVLAQVDTWTAKARAGIEQLRALLSEEDDADDGGTATT